MKSMSIQDQFYCTKTLRHIRLPTVDDPFTYCGLRWCARMSKLASLVKARDMVLIESSGFRRMLINGSYERVGFVSYHSVDLPEVLSLESQGMLRSRFSACVLFRQQSPDVIDVFATVATQPGGEVLFKFSAFQAAEVLITVCNLTESAMKKKLVWMQAARAYGMPNATSPFITRWRSMRQSFCCSSKLTCRQCSRELKTLSKTTKCEICATHVCSRCITTCKLVFGYTVAELEYRSTLTCQGCITTAREMDNSKALAVYEFVQPLDHLRESDYNVKQVDVRMQHGCRLSVDTLSLTSETMHQCSTPNEGEDGEAIGSPPPTSIKTPEQFANELTRERLRLWEQINVLRVQAKETYGVAMNHAWDTPQQSQ
jgi:hypothetical protein